jgi:DHA2 family multidrug resistance protein
MEQYDLFYHKVPLFVRIPVLFLIFFVILVANGVFLGNSTAMYSSLAVNAEPYTVAFNAMSIGMALGLIFHIRLKLRFTNKALLLWGLSLILLTNIICATTDDPTVVIFACLILGFTKISALMEVFLIWMLIWSKKLDTSRMYPFLYFNALAGATFVTWLTTIMAYDYNWRFAYLWIIAVVLLCIVSVLFLVENHPLHRKYPLYQVDYFGLVLLATSMMLLNYAVVYGEVEDWLDSRKIVAAFLCSGITLLLFIKRELKLKRPMFDFRLFQRQTFLIGLFYLLIAGLFTPTTFQSAFSGGILHYEMYRNMELNMYTIPGILIGCVFCYFWYYYAHDPDILIIGGFAGLIIYHILMYNNFGTEFAIGDFWLSSLIKGFATALLYIALGLQITKNLGINLVMSGAGMMILVRQFLGSGVFTSLYGYFLYVQRIKNFDHLVGLYATTNSMTNDQRNLGDVYGNLQEQATLTASKELSGYIIIAGIMLLMVLTARFYHRRFFGASEAPLIKV